MRRFSSLDLQQRTGEVQSIALGVAYPAPKRIFALRDSRSDFDAPSEFSKLLP